MDIQIEELPNSVRDAIKAMKHEEYTHTLKSAIDEEFGSQKTSTAGSFKSNDLITSGC